MRSRRGWQRGKGEARRSGTKNPRSGGGGGISLQKWSQPARSQPEREKKFKRPLPLSGGVLLLSREKEGFSPPFLFPYFFPRRRKKIEGTEKEEREVSLSLSFPKREGKPQVEREGRGEEGRGRFFAPGIQIGSIERGRGKGAEAAKAKERGREKPQYVEQRSCWPPTPTPWSHTRTHTERHNYVQRRTEGEGGRCQNWGVGSD